MSKKETLNIHMQNAENKKLYFKQYEQIHIQLYKNFMILNMTNLLFRGLHVVCTNPN